MTDTPKALPWWKKDISLPVWGWFLISFVGAAINDLIKLAFA